jgi:hypothetical protein
VIPPLKFSAIEAYSCENCGRTVVSEIVYSGIYSIVNSDLD